MVQLSNCAVSFGEVFGPREAEGGGLMDPPPRPMTRSFDSHSFACIGLFALQTSRPILLGTGVNEIVAFIHSCKCSVCLGKSFQMPKCLDASTCQRSACCRNVESCGWSLVTRIMVKAAAANTLPWSRGTWEVAPSSSKASPESMVISGFLQIVVSLPSFSKRQWQGVWSPFQRGAFDPF